jgi:hypothetical protein
MGRDTTPTPDGRRWLHRRGRIVIVGVVAAFTIAAVPVAWATFTDVPPSNPFYAAINALQGAGITTGCGGGNFCPNDNITRQAEAAFVHRAAGRVALSVDDGLELTGTDNLVDAIEIVVGGVSGTQFVKVDASVDFAYPDVPGRYVQFWLRDAGTGATSPTYQNFLDGNDDYQHTQLTWVFPASSGVHVYELRAGMVNGAGDASAFSPTMTAATSTFGAGGGNAIGSEAPSGQGTPAGPPGSPHGK